MISVLSILIVVLIIIISVLAILAIIFFKELKPIPPQMMAALRMEGDPPTAIKAGTFVPAPKLSAARRMMFY